MQLGNSSSKDPKAAIRSTPNSIFYEIGINQETANMITRRNIPSDGIFRHKLLRKYSRACTDISKIPVVTQGKSRVFFGGYKKIFLGLLRTVNRFCNFVVKRQRLKAIESKKKQGHFGVNTFNTSEKSVRWKSNLFYILSFQIILT